MDIRGVVSKRTAFLPPGAGSTPAMGMFEMASSSAGTTSVTSNVALTDGSSQQGKARRASVASNCVVARRRSTPSAAA